MKANWVSSVLEVLHQIKMDLVINSPVLGSLAAADLCDVGPGHAAGMTAAGIATIGGARILSRALREPKGPNG